jgi:hypothetical protein
MTNPSKSLDERINEQVARKQLDEVKSIDSSNTYTKDAKVEQVQSYLTKANEVMLVLNNEIKDVKTLDELIQKKEQIKVLYNDLRDALCSSLDTIIYY